MNFSKIKKYLFIIIFLVNLILPTSVAFAGKLCGYVAGDGRYACYDGSNLAADANRCDKEPNVLDIVNGTIEPGGPPDCRDDAKKLNCKPIDSASCGQLAYTYACIAPNGKYACVKNNSDTKCQTAVGCAVNAECKKIDNPSLCNNGGSTANTQNSSGDSTVERKADCVKNPNDCIYNPLPTSDLTGTFLLIVKGFLGIVAAWAVMFIIVGGFKMVMSAGNEEAYTEAKKTITWAILGLVIASLSFSIMAIVQNLLRVTLK